jgi:hypothetical protein
MGLTATASAVSAYAGNCLNRIIRGRPFWSRLSSLEMITYERSTLDEP